MDRNAAKGFLLLLGEVLDDCRIPFFLVQGTALGAYRDKGFTPTERDIDIGVLFEDFDSYTIINELIHEQHGGVEVNTEYRSNRSNWCHTIVTRLANRDCKADIVSFAKYGEERYCQSPIDVKPPYCIVHEASILENYEQVEMFGRVWHVPSPIETYLEREYGPNWRTPREDHISRTRVYNYLKDRGL